MKKMMMIALIFGVSVWMAGAQGNSEKTTKYATPVMKADMPVKQAEAAAEQNPDGKAHKDGSCCKDKKCSCGKKNCPKCNKKCCEKQCCKEGGKKDCCKKDAACCKKEGAACCKGKGEAGKSCQHASPEKSCSGHKHE